MFVVFILTFLIAGCSAEKAAPVGQQQVQAAPVFVSKAVLKSVPIEIQAHARLHFGFLDLWGSSGRRYGGIGLGRLPVGHVRALSDDEVGALARAAGRVVARPRRGRPRSS